MGIATAKFSDGIYFTNQKGRREKNDFYINFFVSGKLKDSTIKRDKCAHAYILGLERLFKNDASLGTTMENFAKAFNKNGNDGCEVSYEQTPYGNALVVSFAGDIIKEMMSVTIQLSEKYEFTAEFQDKESIGITVHFDDFDQFYSDMNQTIEQGAIITAYETPYIEKLAINFDWEKFKDVEKIEDVEKHKNVVPNGKIGEISWDLGNIEKAEAYLCDEDGILIPKTSPCKIKIDKNRKFKLNVEKNGKTTSQLLEVKDAPCINDFHVEYKKDHLNNIIEYRQQATIKWSISCTEDISTSLYDGDRKAYDGKNGNGYDFTVEKDTTFTLKIEKEDIVVYQDLNIYRTLWKNAEKPYPANIPFKPEEIVCNKFFYSNDFPRIDGDKSHTTDVNFFYVHPYIYPFYRFNDLEKCLNDKDKICKFNKDAPKNFIHYSCFYNKIISHEALTICYTCTDKIVITTYDFKNCNWAPTITIDGPAKKDLDKDGTIISCHYAYNPKPKSATKLLFVVYESFIKIYEIDDSNTCLKVGSTTMIPPSSKTQIVSIDTSLDQDCNNVYLALLCKDEQDQNYVYAYKVPEKTPDINSTDPTKYRTTKNNQTIVTIANSYNLKKTFMILNNGVFPIEQNNDLQDENFSPYETITDKENDFILISQFTKVNYPIQAIVKNGNNINTWNILST